MNELLKLNEQYESYFQGKGETIGELYNNTNLDKLQEMKKLNQKIRKKANDLKKENNNDIKILNKIVEETYTNSELLNILINAKVCNWEFKQGGC